MMFSDKIDALRKEYGLDPDLYSDEEVIQTVEMIKLHTGEYVKLMTNGLDEEIKIKVRKKRLKWVILRRKSRIMKISGRK